MPVEITFDLLRAWQYRRGYVEYAHFPGEPHAFGYRPSAASTRLQALIIDFCARMWRCVPDFPKNQSVATPC
ncbi:MAG: hypothetical protein R3E84_10420 [Pseudomonadales bacterium]